jgi:hypothetical protein
LTTRAFFIKLKDKSFNLIKIEKKLLLNIIYFYILYQRIITMNTYSIMIPSMYVYRYNLLSEENLPDHITDHHPAGDLMNYSHFYDTSDPNIAVPPYFETTYGGEDVFLIRYFYTDEDMLKPKTQEEFEACTDLINGIVRDFELPLQDGSVNVISNLYKFPVETMISLWSIDEKYLEGF